MFYVVLGVDGLLNVYKSGRGMIQLAKGVAAGAQYSGKKHNREEIRAQLWGYNGSHLGMT